MEPLTNWLQDWSDACQYARECAPDFSAFPVPDGEPFTAFLAIGGLCYLLWARNERRIRMRAKPARGLLVPQGRVEAIGDRRSAPAAVGTAEEKLAA